MPNREITAPLPAEMHRGSIGPSLFELDMAGAMGSLTIDTTTSDNDTHTSTPDRGSPARMVTPPGISTFTMFSERKRLGSEITITPTTQRPTLPRKINTAPTGSLHMVAEARLEFKPQLLRRAISSTTAQALARSGTRDRRRPSEPLLSMSRELSRLEQVASRSPVSKMKSRMNSGSRIGLKPRPLIWRMSSPPKAFELPPELKPSFSEKKRVKEALKAKKLEMIRVEVLDTKPQGRPSTPASSIVLTPDVFYKRPASVRTRTPPTPAGKCSPSRGTPLRVTTPLGIGTPPRCNSSFGNATSPRFGSTSSSPIGGARYVRTGAFNTRAKHFSLPLSPVAQCIPWRRSVVAHRAPRNTTPISERKPVYVPGDIQLEDSIPVTLERSSVPDLERFDDGALSQADRFSDVVALDGITMYFEALGVVSAATDACLDKYWLRNRPDSQTGPGTTAKSASTSAPVMSPAPSRPLVSTFEGIFRSQKALRDGEKSSPSSGTAGRRKPLLRQLLKSNRKSN